MYRDSVGNTYASLPAKKANKGAKGAKPGPKHGRKSRYAGDKKKHGINTGSNGSPWYVHLFAHVGGRKLCVDTPHGVAGPGALELDGANSPRGGLKSQNGKSGQ